ncbi:hypothetical protein ACER0A_002425 [Haloimpatiens sp. FM7315]|uniref:DUF7922 domain-containing protein n=1 Tax=Haloimpatiens sp. FM7315 TaxID=3298609 RepID=UPI003977D3CB
MASKKSYSRYFIILQEDENGYALAAGKNPTGYAKIEIKNSKCKISYYVQNLKHETNKYCMILICGKKGSEKLLNIGAINLDNQGRAEISYEYEVDNIGGTNISIDKVVGASIVKIMGSNVISLMSGFTTTDIPKNWRNFTLVDVNKKREDKNEFDEYEENIEKNKEKADNKIVEHRENVEKEKEIEEKEIEELDDRNLENTNEDDEEDRKEKEDYFEESEDDLEDLREDEGLKDSVRKDKKAKCKPKGEKEKFFEDIAEDFDKYYDIFPKIKKSLWFKINVNDMEDICDMSDYNKYVMLYYPMICYYPYVKMHKHYMVGYKYDEDCRIKYIMYAIPGDKTEKDQPFGGKTGFVTWMQSSNVKNSKGYWIMFYDFKNSCILIPVKKKK